MISPEDLSLFRVTDSVDEAVDEILRFYRVFESMAYTNNRLELQLKQRIAGATLLTLQRDFTDILTDGDIRQEADPSGAKLVFHFNRRSLGRLREFINTLNDAPA